ncbi:uncharacterized protein LOC116351845 [Contarinia nasturtii]|uniref:uncharacterized protein LOC116351845 n=1 Tax=Contarinia nasturtii TaxID=265458 RepID=UPI0012D45012|nr:uncharacterized protein LOC116351845 [Contarinia nasturtii]
MKRFSFSSLLLLSLFVQSINSEGNLTFSMFLEKFHAKAAEKGIEMGSGLNCIFTITNTMDKAKTKHAVPVTKLMTETKFRQVMDRVPAGMQVVIGQVTVNDEESKHERGNARAFLRNKIYLINNDLTEKIGQLNMEIYTEIAHKPFIANDKMFANWFKLWDKDQMDEEHLKNIKKEIRAMAAQYEVSNREFKKKMKEVDNLRKTIDNYFRLANEKCDNLLKAKNYTEFPRMVQEIVPLIERIYKSQSQLIENLENVQNLLKDYNMKRIIWVELLIGLRESLTSNRRSINLEFLLLFFTNLCCGRNV